MGSNHQALLDSRLEFRLNILIYPETRSLCITPRAAGLKRNTFFELGLS